MMKSKHLGTFSILGLVLCGMTSTPALADDVQAVSWADKLKISGHLDGGVTFNPRLDAGQQNMGALFQDKANQLLLNQAMATVQLPVDNQAANYDVGFTLTGMYGSDARYTHSYAMLDHLVHDRNQLDIVQATVDIHAPIMPELLASGVDVKVGIFPSPMGAEVIDSTSNYLYSHSYIFNFGLPYKNTGALATWHITPVLDLYTGLDTGVNSFVTKNGYNNGWAKGQFGFGLNFLDGALTVIGFTHVGAENPASLGSSVSSGQRFLNDITTTWKVDEDLTLTTDINYIHDEGLGAIGYGAAQYAVYTLNDHVSLVGRAEVWRDNAGAFVASFPGQFDFVNAERGLPATTASGGHTTYGALTVGMNYKPNAPKSLEGLMIRPEFRVDDALNGTKPFRNGKDDMSFTPAIDIVIPF